MKSKFLIGLLVCLAVCLGALLFGGEVIYPSELQESGSTSYRILFQLRLPRFLLAFFIGGTLAMLGGTYQILFNNSLAEPYLLGIASAVTLGAAVAELVLGVPPLALSGTLLGFIVAMGVTSLLVGLSFTTMARDSNRLVLFGMAVNFVLSSVLFLLVTYFYQGFGVGSLRWLFGQILWVSYREVAILFVLGIPLLCLLVLFGRRLDALSLGDEVAKTLGVSARQTRAFLLFVSSALLALTITFSGAIGFVGLVTPHAARLLFRPSSTRLLFIYSFLLGATFLVLADAIAKAIAPPLEFPVGVVTTLLGGPLFLLILWRRS